MEKSLKKSSQPVRGNGVEKRAGNRRLEVLKTYKLYIGGQFPRTESGRYYTPTGPNGRKLANVCQASRKDFRDAVVAARNALGGWSSRPAFNRGQILYRMAEMLEGRKAQFMEELQAQGLPRLRAERDVSASVDRLIYYAGWCDKFQQLFSTVNPVASSHFSFSVPEPTGVVAIIAPQQDALLGLVSVLAPVLAGANTCVVLAAESLPLCAVTLAEVLHSSDLPGGVVNILTGKAAELTGWFAGHMDVNATLYCENDSSVQRMIREKATSNLKRTVFYADDDWRLPDAQSPYRILDFQEIKTTWHPIENIAGSGASY
ncbi:MAG TPA: aldehyde dehydrogenase family protein [Chitinophagaceae bacterium]|nr:aldehyde dehydrogenase family protein [Chitinophagaceae bacterium]